MSKELIHIDVDHAKEQCDIAIIGDPLKLAANMANVARNIEGFKTAILLAAKYIADKELEAQQETEAFMAEVHDILQNHKPSGN